MRRVQDADAATHDHVAVVIDGPGEAGARPEVHPAIGVVRPRGIAQGAEIQRPQIGWRLEVHDLHGNLAGGPQLHRGVIIVPDAQIQHERAVHAPVVLDEATELLQV